MVSRIIECAYGGWGVEMGGGWGYCPLEQCLCQRCSSVPTLDLSRILWGWLHVASPFTWEPSLQSLADSLARTWHGRQLGEAGQALMRHAFETRKLRRVSADIDPENAASIRLLETLGMRREGHLRATWETHLGVRDSYIYARLATD